MPGAFFPAFNSFIPDMEAQFTETWIHKNTEYPAIVIELLDVEFHMIKGGILEGQDVRIHVREDIYFQSAVKINDDVTVRGITLSVKRIQSDGDAARVLVCSTLGTDVWK